MKTKLLTNKEQKLKNKCDEYIKTIAVLGKWKPDENSEEIDTWYSKIDGSYITFSNLTRDLEWMIKLGITEQVQSSCPEDPRVACIGYNPVEQKWYGWSHRAVFGFGIGSEVKKGDCGYKCTDMQDFIDYSINFWSDEATRNIDAIEATNERGELGVQITYEYVEENVPNKNLHGTIGEQFMYAPKKWGKGEWKAETLEDAKQMAIDFARSVS